jgi:hypothetical protein
MRSRPRSTKAAARRTAGQIPPGSGLISRREFVAAAGTAAAAAALPGIARAGQGPNGSPAARDVPWLQEVQTPPERLPDGAPQLPSLLRDAQGRPIETLPVWEAHRESLRKAWSEFLNPLRLKQPDNKLTVLEQDRPEGCTRRLVRYRCEDDLEVEGYLLLPRPAPSKPVPGVVVLHSTVNYTIRQPAGLEGPPEKYFGLRLAQRGMVAFCPRCFLWQGEGSYTDRVAEFQRRHPGSLGMAKMLWDAQRAVDILQSLPEVDPQRIGAVGHSLGAKEALYLAAFDPRVQVTVSSEGGIGTRFSNWDAVWYLGPGIRTADFAREHHELLGLCAPRPFLLVGGDSADGDRSWPFIEAALPVYRLYGPTARLGLFNHRRGHSVPPEAEGRIYQWLETYLFTSL